MVNTIAANPLTAVTLHFKDGVALRQVFTNPVPQAKAMAALGQMVANLGGELKIELAPDIFERIEKVSRVIDWEEDIGEWRELKEDDYQALKQELGGV